MHTNLNKINCFSVLQVTERNWWGRGPGKEATACMQKYRIVKTLTGSSTIEQALCSLFHICVSHSCLIPITYSGERLYGNETIVLVCGTIETVF